MVSRAALAVTFSHAAGRARFVDGDAVRSRGGFQVHALVAAVVKLGGDDLEQQMSGSTRKGERAPAASFKKAVQK